MKNSIFSVLWNFLNVHVLILGLSKWVYYIVIQYFVYSFTLLAFLDTNIISRFEIRFSDEIGINIEEVWKCFHVFTQKLGHTCRYKIALWQEAKGNQNYFSLLYYFVVLNTPETYCLTNLEILEPEVITEQACSPKYQSICYQEIVFHLFFFENLTMIIE